MNSHKVYYSDLQKYKNWREEEKLRREEERRKDMRAREVMREEMKQKELMGMFPLQVYTYRPPLSITDSVTSF